MVSPLSVLERHLHHSWVHPAGRRRRGLSSLLSLSLSLPLSRLVERESVCRHLSTTTTNNNNHSSNEDITSNSSTTSGNGDDLNHTGRSDGLLAREGEREREREREKKKKFRIT